MELIFIRTISFQEFVAAFTFRFYKLFVSHYWFHHMVNAIQILHNLSQYVDLSD